MLDPAAQPKAWVDATNVVRIRADVTLDEARELDEMLGAAFNAGVVSGYGQAITRMKEQSDA